MATNGNSTTNQQLDELETTITGGRVPSKLEASIRPMAESANDLLRIAETQAECKLSAARYVLEHAQYLHDLCTADAKQSLAKEREFVGHVLAAEERKMAELRRILGEDRGMTFDGLPRGKYGAILADPPTTYNDQVDGTNVRCAPRLPDYSTLSDEEIIALSPELLAAPDCVLFLWTCWPMLERTFRILSAWGFKFKTCGFCWVKADASQMDMFRDDIDPRIGLGYWTRANSEVCLLATRGHPKRLAGDVRQAIIAPPREHSRKPDGIHERIERLVAGPYLELFARQRRPGWDCWGNEVDKFAPQQVSSAPTDAWAEMWAKPFDFSREPTP